jgi:glycosyltransferase involved in cell wall biosynthesis
MRILHLAPRLGDRGGAERYLLDCLTALRPAHDQRLLAGQREAGLASPCPSRLVPGLAARMEAEVEPSLDEAWDAFQPDVLLLHNLMNPRALLWAAGRPALATLQDHRWFCPGRGKWTRTGEVCREPFGETRCRACFEDGRVGQAYFDGVLGLTRRRLEAGARLPLLVLSEYMRRELEAAGVPAGRIAVVPPGVARTRPVAGAEPACVLFAGRLVEAKGVGDAIHAWRLAGTDLPLLFAGTGPRRPWLAAEPGVEVLGWVPHAELGAVFGRARALLFPSRWQEPCGIVGLEALAAGVPVVAWESGGLGEWHPGGFAPWGDEEGLAARLGAALEAPRPAPGPPAGYEFARFRVRLEAALEAVRRGAPAGCPRP